MIILVASPSASGKTTLVNNVIDHFNLKRLITTTTRKKRPEERGDEYYFVSMSEFAQMVNSGMFVEYNNVYGNMYGLTKAEVDSNLQNKSIAVLDVGGVEMMKMRYGDQVKTIFILPPSIDELKARLDKREINDDDENQRRLAALENELIHVNEYDYIIEQDSLENMIASFSDAVSKIICPVFRGL